MQGAGIFPVCSAKTWMRLFAEGGSHLPCQLLPLPAISRYLGKSKGTEGQGEGIYPQEITHHGCGVGRGLPLVTEWGSFHGS